MQSSHQPIIYPQQDNLFNEFFKLIQVINTAVKPEILHLIFPKIKKYNDQHLQLALDFDEHTFNINPNPPSLEQLALYAVESSMLRFLRVLCARKSKEFGGEISSDSYQTDLKFLRHHFNPGYKSEFPITDALQIFMSIAVAILELNECSEDLKENDVVDFISTSMTILDCLCKFRSSHCQLSKERIVNVAPTFAEEIQCLVYVLVYDTKPTSASQNFAAFLANIFVRKLIRCHLQLESKMRALSGKPEAKLAHHQLGTWIVEVDSVTRRLNMYQSQRERALFTQQGKKYNRNTGSYDISLWCNSTTAENLYTYLDSTLHNLYSRMDLIQILDCYLRTLRITTTKYDPDFDTILLRQVESMVFKARLLRQQAFEISCEPLVNEQGSDRAKRLMHYEGLNQGINLIITTMWGMLHAMYQARELPIHLSTWAKTILQTVNSISVDAVNFCEFESELASCNVGMLFEVSLGLKLHDAKPGLEREDIASAVAMNLIELVTHLGLVRETLTKEKEVYARQFILDYYYTSLLQCDTNAERTPLLNVNLRSIIQEQMDGESPNHRLKNYPVYKAVDVFSTRICQDGLLPKQVNDEHFSSLSSEEKFELFLVCTQAIEMLQDNTFRVSTSLRIFLIKYAIQYLTFFTNSSNHLEVKKAKALLRRLNEYCVVVEKFTATSFKKMMELKIPHEPVRMIASNPDSFLPKMVKPPTGVTAQSSGNSSKVKNPSQGADRKKFNIASTYEENVKVLDGDMGAVYKAYDKLPLISKDKEQCLRALLGLARHLEDIESDNVRKSVIKKINNNAEAVLANCVSFATKDEISVFRQQLDGYLAKYIEVEKTSDVVVSKSAVTHATLFKDKKSAEVLSQKNNSQRKFMNDRRRPPQQSYSGSAKCKPMRAQKSGQVPQPIPYVWKVRSLAQIDAAPSAPVMAALAHPDESPRRIEKSLIITKNPYHGMHGNLVLKIELNTIQKNVVQLLAQNNMVPYLHGGSVVYAAMLKPDIVIKPKPDVDIGCFPPSREVLFQLFVTHQQLLGIQDIEKDIWHDDKYSVYHLTIRDTASHDIVDKIEIAYLPVTTHEEIQTKIREKAESFGTNATGYCDAVTMRIFYPTHQIRQFIEKRIIDVALDEGGGRTPETIVQYINDYLRTTPQRQLDCVDRAAKLGHYGCTLMVSPRLLHAIFINRPALQQHLASFAKVDRLFLQGYAADTFSIMHQFNMLTVLFPMLQRHHIPAFYRACTSIDEDIHNHEGEKLSPDTLMEYRMNFLAKALHPAFVEGWLSDESKDDAYIIYTEGLKFLKQTRVYVSSEYINFTRMQTHLSECIKKYLNYESVLVYIEPTGLTSDCINHLTGQTIENPVFCTLDCRTYEEAEIVSYLAFHRCAPTNENRLQPWQKIEDVIVPHEEIRMAIHFYREGMQEETGSEMMLENIFVTKYH